MRRLLIPAHIRRDGAIQEEIRSVSSSISSWHKSYPQALCLRQRGLTLVGRQAPPRDVTRSIFRRKYRFK